ncbi:hypothetical protein FJD08_20230, partial [Escherichia coli]|nr:hypothetical protein [Escherichia coli]
MHPTPAMQALIEQIYHIFRRYPAPKQFVVCCEYCLSGFAPIFPDTCYHLTHYWLAAVDIPVASDNPVHYADAIRYNAR